MRASSNSQAGLDYRVHRPAPPLDGLVDYLWSLRDVPSHTLECIIPSGTFEIVLNLYEDEFRIHKPNSGSVESARFRGAIASGAYRSAFVAETRAHASIMGVHFKPGGAAAVLGVSGGELADAHVELEALWGRRAESLRDRLCAEPDPDERLRILERALFDSLARASTIRPEIHVALARLSDSDPEVRDVAKELQLSHRRFIELFTEQVGMTPKRYSRVVRFQRALTRVAGVEAPAWTEVALECGYFDQSHLCHDWLEFTGFSPVDFLRLRSVRVKENHVAVPEQAKSKFSNTPAGRRV